MMMSARARRDAIGWCDPVSDLSGSVARQVAVNNSKGCCP